MNVTFYKYQGTGNDFILFDDRDLDFPTKNHELIRRLCDRKFGIGADGLILLQPHSNKSYFMKYYNSDGQESSMCGNGGRCIAAFAMHQKIVANNHLFMAIDGIHEAEGDIINKDSIWVKLNMKNVIAGEPRLENTFVLDTGSPHYVQFTTQPVSEIDIIQKAKQIRYNDEFSAKGINVNFVNTLSPNHIAMRTYERGVEDETLSCGTGVTAAALSMAMLNHYSSGVYKITVETQGGQLNVSYNYDSDKGLFTDIYLEGPATLVYRGTIEI
jgi:diaminopimelate epimerase